MKIISSCLFIFSFFLSSAEASDFWRHWGDGMAELNRYELEFPRYGEIRKGEALAIFVTETFSHRNRVKTEAKQDRNNYPVMKLNLLKDFPTGVYDYNTMLSVFANISESAIIDAGKLSKVSFSSQEWCGHAYSQAIFENQRVRFQSHSYFEEEADQDKVIKVPSEFLSLDEVFFWARGFGELKIEPGQKKEIQLLESLETVRLNHLPITTFKGQISRTKKKQQVAGYTVEEFQVAWGKDNWLKIYVEQAHPKRIISWEKSSGEKATLIKSKRLSYWKLQKNSDLKEF